MHWAATADNKTDNPVLATGTDDEFEIWNGTADRVARRGVTEEKVRKTCVFEGGVKKSIINRRPRPFSVLNF